MTKAKLIWAAVLAALLFGAGWVAQGWRAEVKLYDTKRAHAEQMARQAAQALADYERLEKQKDEAIQAHAALVAQNAATADAARAAADRMRRDLADMPRRIAAASREAVDQYAAAAGKLLGACTAEYQWLAERADGHAADVRLMQDAWPK